jgi:hypothetical protein
MNQNKVGHRSVSRYWDGHLERRLCGMPSGIPGEAGIRAFSELSAHLDVSDAGFFERLAVRQVPQARIERLGAALRMQGDFTIAARRRRRLERTQHGRTMTAAAQYAVHRHAPDPRDAG